MPSPLVPVPLEVRLTVTLPLKAPTSLVSRPTCSAVLLPPAASRLTEPVPTAPPVLATIPASSFSEKPSAVAVFVRLRFCAATKSST